MLTLLADCVRDASEIAFRSEEKKLTTLAVDDAGTSGLTGTGTGEAGIRTAFHEADVRIWERWAIHEHADAV
jgi:hypothetical protein